MTLSFDFLNARDGVALNVLFDSATVPAITCRGTIIDGDGIKPGGVEPREKIAAIAFAFAFLGGVIAVLVLLAVLIFDDAAARLLAVFLVGAAVGLLAGIANIAFSLVQPRPPRELAVDRQPATASKADPSRD